MSAEIIQLPRPTTYEPWLDEGAVARHFATSTRTIRRHRRAGMPSFKMAGQRRYRLSECERWMLARGVELSRRAS